ncbi:MAG: dihydropteroate synthase [Bacteroidota bacterium]
MKNTFFCKKNTINVQGKIISLQEQWVMGILNVTPDSFYDGGAHNSIQTAIAQTEKLLNEGAQIIDVGGYSTRPNADDIALQEEINRVVPVIAALKQKFPNIIISIDTFRAEVARQAIQHGAAMINDISAGELDPTMFETVAALQVPYILMHNRGTPQNMQNQTDYTNMMDEIITFFSTKINKLKALGVNDLIIDPGFGFAKTLDQNYELLQKLSYFNVLELPILVGLSRKSMVYKLLQTTAAEALNGTTVLHTLALEQGASILRVHDVKEAVETIILVNKFMKS